jgi:hypothetical protein
MVGAWWMFAHRYDDGLLWNVGSIRFVEHHGLSEPIVKVDVHEVAEDSPDGTHWGWLDSDDRDPTMIYPHRGMLEMCFPYGSKVEIERGKGRVVRLAVTETGDA